MAIEWDGTGEVGGYHIGPGVDLTGADLRGLDLSGADLTGANLSGALLKGTNLRDANLTDAYLRRTDLTGAKLDGIQFWGAVVHPSQIGILREACHKIITAEYYGDLYVPPGHPARRMDEMVASLRMEHFTEPPHTGYGVSVLEVRDMRGRTSNPDYGTRRGPRGYRY